MFTAPTCQTITIAKTLCYHFHLKLEILHYGTESRNRTGTALRPLDFESNVSTNFTTSAEYLPRIIKIPYSCQSQLPLLFLCQYGKKLLNQTSNRVFTMRKTGKTTDLTNGVVDVTGEVSKSWTFWLVQSLI